VSFRDWRSLYQRRALPVFGLWVDVPNLHRNPEVMIAARD
jgi:hypothetical protein